MATQRPDRTRGNTDIHNEERGETSSNDFDKKTPSPEITYMGEEPYFHATKEDHFGEAAVLTDAKDVLTHVLHVDDDPTLSPWTFRAFFLGESPSRHHAK